MDIYSRPKAMKIPALKGYITSFLVRKPTLKRGKLELSRHQADFI